MKNKLLVVFGLLFFHGSYGAQADFDNSDSESVSSKSSESAVDKLVLSHEKSFAASDSSSSDGTSSSGSSSSSSAESDESDDSDTVQDKSIDKTWGLKNLLLATPDHDLYRSPLLGLIAVGNGTIKKWYGDFTDVVIESEEGRPARTKRVFTLESSLEKITRAFFNILDNRVRCVAAGSSPMIALSAEAVGQLVILTQEQGLSGVIAFLEKGLVRKQKQKKQLASKQSLQQQVSLEELFINEWWNRYELRAEKGKFSEERDFRKRLMPLFQDLKTLETEQGTEKTKQIFLTLLMAFLVLKDQTEGQKDPDYGIENYFKKLGVVYTRDYYTTLEKKVIQKRIAKSSFGTTIKDFEDVVFYLVALAKNDFEFVNAPYVSAVFKEIVKGKERDVARPLCAEATVRSFVNLVLFNPITQHFDDGMLPEGMRLDPLVYDFYFNPEHSRTDPQTSRYYIESADAWIQVIVALHKKFPEIIYRENELSAKPENMLLVFNKIFRTTVQSFQELGNLLSKDGSQIVIEAAESIKELGQTYKEKWTIAVERDGSAGEDTYAFFAILQLFDGHALFGFDMDNIMSLIGKHQYRLIEGLQKIYGIELWPIVLNAASINAVIDEETPFKKAIESGNIPLVKLLIAYGADMYQLDDDWLGALAYAYSSGSSEMIKFFTDQGLKINASLESIYDWLWVTETMEDKVFDEIMASNETDSGQQKKDFYSTALMVCLDRNWIDHAKKLIKGGADVNFIEDSYQEGDLHGAPILSASSGITPVDEAFVNILVDALEPAGDDKNRATVYGTALDRFLIKKYMHAVQVLLEKGADVSFCYEIPNCDSTLPSYVRGVVVNATECGDMSLMQLVVDRLPVAGEDKMRTRLYGEALKAALYRNWFDIAVQLVEKGAALDSFDEPLLNYILWKSESNQAAVKFLQVIGIVKKSDAFAQMYKDALHNHMSVYRKTEEWLKQYEFPVQKVVQKVEQAVESDVLKLEEVFGEEQ